MEKTDALCEKFELDSLPLPRVRKVPRRIDSASAPFVASTVEEHYRPEFYKVIDTCLGKLSEYFSNNDLNEIEKLSRLLTDDTNMENHDHLEAAIKKYPELQDTLKLQLQFFKSQFKYGSLEDVQQSLTTMLKGNRSWFNQVEALLRLCMISPASSCTAERSFSSLRRLKTFLRSTMSQDRLNGLMMCQIHQNLAADIDHKLIAKKFIEASVGTRSKIFGIISC